MKGRSLGCGLSNFVIVPRSGAQLIYTNILKHVIPAGTHIRLSLPDALRVNANLFQTDLCRDPEAMDGKCRLVDCFLSK
jgi:hypothetical protein